MKSKFYTRPVLVSLLLSGAVLYALGGCSNLKGFTADPGFTAEVVRGEEMALLGVVTGFQKLTMEESQEYAALMQKLIAEKRPQYKLLALEKVRESVGPGKFDELTALYVTDGMFLKPSLDVFRQSIQARYLAIVRVEQDETGVPQWVRQGWETDPEERAKWGTIVNVWVDRSVLVSLRIYDLKQPRQVWYAQADTWGREEKPYTVQNEAEIEQVLALEPAGEGMGTSAGHPLEKRFPSPDPSPLSLLLARTIRDMAAKLP
ncbi:MAG: hypothetical protein OEZ59_09405 [Deltaproteobacteria bacterium]|nr:hypothetical protein [Deltaproteobacteria bacterium]